MAKKTETQLSSELFELVRRWRAKASVHQEYSKLSPTYADCKAYSFRACADELEAVLKKGAQ